MTLYVSKRMNDGNDKKIEVEEQAEIYQNLQNIIIDYFQTVYIKNFVAKNYDNLLSAEKEEIIRKAKQKIDKNILLYELQHSELPKDYIDIEGLINFRLKDFKAYIDDLVDEEVEDLIYKQEYDEFLHLLRFFISIQEPKCKTLHIICCEGNFYQLYDENFVSIQKGLVQSIANEFGEQLTVDDLLISNILTLAPEKVVIHNMNYLENQELLKTIKTLFEDHISFCMGCVYCKTTNPTENK